MIKKILFTVSLLFSFLFANSQTWEITPNSQFEKHFEEAYATYPSIPRGILESIAYTKTHIQHIEPEYGVPSCTGLPFHFGVMGLVEDGKNYFRNSLLEVASISKYTIEDIKLDPKMNILAFAKAYDALLELNNLRNQAVQNHKIVIDALSEIPNNQNAANNFAFDTQLYSIFKNLLDSKFQEAYNLPKYSFSLEAIFGGENFQILNSSSVSIENNQINGRNYNSTYNRLAPPCNDVSGSFPYTVLSAAADPSNYSSRGTATITHVTIHTMQGSYAGAISWFQNPLANVSAHYNMRASDGQITQSVCEIDKAWHVSNSNPYAVGIEHEGYIDDPTWYTNITYQVSAILTKDIAARNGIPIIRTYDKNGDVGVNSISDGCFKIKGHQHFPSQTHVDPGPFWDWNRYYDLINDVASANTVNYTVCSGTIYDSGGAGGNYGSDERVFYRIAPTGATSVTINFSSLNLETNYDYLYIYDGDSHNDPLLAVLNGTTLPPAITANSGKMLMEFRTDCATVASGWVANYSCNTSAVACEMPVGLSQSNMNHNSVQLNWNIVAGALSYEISFKQTLESSPTIYTSTTNNIVIYGLAAGAQYIWTVKSVCGAGVKSVANSNEFTNTSIITNVVDTNCSGTFTDTGGILGNYPNNQNYTYTISPTGASSVNLSFSAFNIENNYDFIYIYDGPTTASTLLGTYTNTNTPPNITSSGGSLTIKFTSDNSTVKSGWIANWNCNTSCNLPSVPTLSVSPTTVCSGETSTITITGNLNDATAWNIYSGSCGGTLVGSTTNSTFNVNPTSTTTYYIRGEGACVSGGSCASSTITVNPAPEINITGNGNSILIGDSTPSTTDNTDFGLINSTTITKTFTIENITGAADLNISTIVVSGTNSSNFTIGNITLPKTITVGSSTTFTVTFTPTDIGSRTAIITVNNNDCNESAYNFTVLANLNCGDITTTWNGSSWNNGNPALTKSIIFSGNYNSTGSVLGCSATLNSNAQVTINTNHTLILNDAINVNSGSLLTIENNGALRQVNDVANIGNIVVKRNSSPMIRLDYTGWSSPVAGQQLQTFSPNTLSNRFYEYLYTGTTTATAFQVVNSNTNFLSGKGYLIRAANNWSASTPTNFNGIFNGIPSNGTMNISVGLGYNLLGNPYSSPISGNSFLGQNPSIDALYFWTHTAAASGGSYTVNNYASYTTLGGTAAAAGGQTPNGIINTGQGFYINKTIAGGNIIFKNNQRINASASSQFFRTEENETHRFWLNLNNNSNNYNQILIGYTELATNNIDSQIDGRTLDLSQTTLYSLIDNEEFVIQGRGLPFTNEDILPLGLKIDTDGNYFISFENADGLFINQDIFIKDNLTATIHNVKMSPYQFYATIGTFNNRFEIIFKNSILGVDDFNFTGLQIYSSNEVITVRSNNEEIQEVLVFDILGRKLYHKQNVNSNELEIKNLTSQKQTLLVKVKSATNKERTVKVIF
ncbi:CUB domain-containing protein [Flavobacterium sp.]|jgi:N-acetyl-anhydromuramyl-L-alanine amidase AmpD|uniref:CUB domain-containing protein n=1 Tax=Flavobacterium sp. TaxID=239 RepID=UPI002A81BCB5|nr:CUB domain-containing protein [Flavobacterium sp.]